MSSFGPVGIDRCLGLCSDAEFLLYFIMFLVSLVGFLLFTWWWRRMRRATEVYAYVTALLGANVYGHGILTVVRGLWLLGYVETSIQITTSYWWAFRTLPELICVVLIVSRMWKRACRTLYLERRYLRKGSTKSCLGEGLENAEED